MKKPRSSIFKGKPDGKRPWCWRRFERQPDGTLKGRTKWYARKCDAEDAKAAWDNRVVPGIKKMAEDIDVRTYWRDHFRPARCLGRRPATLNYYDGFFRSYIEPHFGGMPVRDLIRPDIKACAVSLLSADVVRNGRTLRKGHRPSTVKGLLATFQVFCAAAVEDGLLVANPVVGLWKALYPERLQATLDDATDVKAMDRGQLRTFLIAAEQHTPEYADLFFLLGRSGLRIGEALALRIDAIDLERKTLRVERAIARGEDGRPVLAPPKTKRGKRTVKLTPQVVARLRARIEAAKVEKLQLGWRDFSPWLFHAQVDPSTYTTATAGTLDSANVRRAMRRVLRTLPAEFKGFSLHCFRHSFASQLVAEGQPIGYVSEQLGHESVALTSRLYANWLPSSPKLTNDLLDDVASH